MKYDVTMSCGHKVEVQLFGKGEERERKIKWLEEYGLCTKCKEEQEKEKAKNKGLPELEGTEKQIKWAMTIRNKILDGLENMDKSNYTPKAIKEYNLFTEWLKNKKEAKFWIDHENPFLRELIKEYKEEKSKTK